mgnify:CR=1 FL=1
MPSANRHPRLVQLVASLGYGSRREVEIAIKRGILRVEGASKVTGDMRVDPELIRYDGQPLDHPAGLLVVLHKPVGHVCSHAEEEGPSVYDLLPERWRRREPQVVSVGRLDKETSGLLLLTDQHELVHRLSSPKHHVEKVYEAELDRPVSAETAGIFASGELVLRGESKPCLPARLEVLAERRVRLILEEGRYHQVRRMFAAVGNHVVALHRARFGSLDLDGVLPGEYRHLPLNAL